MLIETLWPRSRSSAATAALKRGGFHLLWLDELCLAFATPFSVGRILFLAKSKNNSLHSLNIAWRINLGKEAGVIWFWKGNVEDLISRLISRN